MSVIKPAKYILAVLLLCWQISLYGEFSKEQLDWLNSDAEHPQTAIVNEGQLKFMAEPASEPEHHQSMHIQLNAESIETGWARVDQCHRDLDAVPDLEVVFHKNNVRDLQVTSYRNIRNAEVIGHRVLVEDISAGSEICLSAESHILKPSGTVSGGRQLQMQNGPFMRRFLDGYYPLTLHLQVEYPHELIRVAAVEPQAQRGWRISYDDGRIMMAGRFEGRLITRVHFTRHRQGMDL